MKEYEVVGRWSVPVNRTVSISKVSKEHMEKLTSLCKVSGKSKSYWGNIALEYFFSKVDLDVIAEAMGAAENEYHNRMDSILRTLG